MLKIFFLFILILFSGCEEKQRTTDNTNVVVDVDLLDFNDSDHDLLSDLIPSSTDINKPYEVSNEENITGDISFEDINITNSSNVNLWLEPYFYQQWYLAKDQIFYDDNDIDSNASIHAETVLNQYTGRGVTIAIIDDGLDITHEDLNGSIVASFDITTRTTNVAHTRQSDYHGTAVTGIIAANRNAKGIIGIASESNIIFLKHREGMSDSETIELFHKADELGADIISCSWGTYDVSSAVKESIQALARNGRDGKGTIIVFAVGNDARDMGNDESSIPEVIAVGATDRDNLRAWYSNYGQNIDIMAPGGYEVGITTIDPMYSNGAATLEENYLLGTDGNSFIGTSPSAPIVSASLALLLEKNASLTRTEIVDILKNSSDKIGNIEYINGWNQYYGYGKLNLQCLLNR